MNNICHPHFVQSAQNKHIRPEIMPTYERKLPALVPIPQDIYTRYYTNVYLCCQHGGRSDGSEKVRFHRNSIHITQFKAYLLKIQFKKINSKSKFVVDT